jgi:hypothetical protein
MSPLKYAFIIQGVLFLIFIFFIVDINNVFINAIYIFQLFGHVAWAAGEQHSKDRK